MGILKIGLGQREVTMAQDLAIVSGIGIRSGAGTRLTLPALFAPDTATAKRIIEFFTANIRNTTLVLPAEYWGGTHAWSHRQCSDSADCQDGSGDESD